MKKFLIATVLSFFLLFQVEAQKAFQFAATLPVNISERSLPFPFAGGINSAQIQQVDVNGDGQEELVVWDRNADNLLVFEKNEGQFIHNPLYTYYFPDDINGFLILADFDKDGKKDLFTSSPFGIKVYKNITGDSTYMLQWKVAQNYLKLENNANFQTNSLDIPAIMDIDGDGDLDIVTFNFASGDFLEFYQNTSIERKGVPDIDGFASAITRWGGFEFCGCENFSFGQTCSSSPILKTRPLDETLKVEHAGGHSILLHDFNGDGVLDMLMGQDECNSLYYLVNEGSNLSPDFNSFSRNLPQLDPLPEFPVFHAGYLLDHDLVITTNSSHTASQYNSDYSQSLYHYQEGANLTTTAFLQEDMVDLGENSRPFFKGNASIGELVVTANGLHENKIVGKAYHFELSAEGLTLNDENFLNLSSLNLTDLQYQEFIATDNRSFLLISGVEVVNFTSIRKLFWSPSLDGQELQEMSVPGVQLRGNDHLEFIHHEGDDFMLLARQTGELIRFKVNFGQVPEIELLDRDYLGFSDNPANRNLNVHVVYTSSDQIDLYAVDQRGILMHIPDFPHSFDPNTEILQWEENVLIETRLGKNTWIASIPAAFGEKIDLILGNTSGGLIHLADLSIDGNLPGERKPQMKIYPNPTPGPLAIISSASGKISLFNTLGQKIMSDIPIDPNIPLEIHTQHVSSGIYFVQLISSSGRRITKKMIVNKM
ncbi:MAG: T9SS type A sorting domain-containing protein [Anditalea sp.]